MRRPLATLLGRSVLLSGGAGLLLLGFIVTLPILALELQFHRSRTRRARHS